MAEETANKRTSPKRKQLSSSKQRSTYESNNEAMKRAEDVQDYLPLQFPIMIKYMLPSYVGFMLVLPKKFCEEHLPKEDTTIVLEDEEGAKFETTYLPAKASLSAGWRGFSNAHDLAVGDVVVFQLVMPRKFKVYIVRANGSEQLEQLEAAAEQLTYENRTKHSEETEPGLITGQSEDENSDGNELILLDSEDENNNANGLGLSDSVAEFDKVKSFEDFEIQTNGLVINSELPKHLQRKYYDLCCSRKRYLHENLPEGLNCKLAAIAIPETVNIADAIRASKASTPSESFNTWRATLEAFSKLGMNVDFLLERLDQLRGIAAKSRKCEEFKAKRNTAEDEMRKLERRILELKEVTEGLDQQLLEMNCVDYDVLFEQVAKADW